MATTEKLIDGAPVEEDKEKERIEHKFDPNLWKSWGPNGWKWAAGSKSFQMYTACAIVINVISVLCAFSAIIILTSNASWGFTQRSWGGDPSGSTGPTNKVDTYQLPTLGLNIKPLVTAKRKSSDPGGPWCDATLLVLEAYNKKIDPAGGAPTPRLLAIIALVLSCGSALLFCLQLKGTRPVSDLGSIFKPSKECLLPVFDRLMTTALTCLIFLIGASMIAGGINYTCSNVQADNQGTLGPTDEPCFMNACVGTNSYYVSCASGCDQGKCDDNGKERRMDLANAISAIGGASNAMWTGTALQLLALICLIMSMKIEGFKTSNTLAATVNQPGMRDEARHPGDINI